MSTPAPNLANTQALAAYDDRPYFARALDYGLKNGIIDSERLDAMRNDGAKGVVQIADYFGTSHLRNDLDDAVRRMVYLASLYLEHMSDGNLVRAARSLQENTFLSHSRGGSQMFKTLFAMPTDSTIPDPDDVEDVKEFLRERTQGAVWSVAEYRTRYEQRRAFKAQVDAALWFAEIMQIPREALVNESSESVLHACLLTRIAGRAEGGLLTADELKTFLRNYRRSRQTWLPDETFMEDVPDVHRPVLERHLGVMIEKDLPRIKDPQVPFNDLVREYHDRFHPLSVSLEVSDYDSLVTDEWRKVTRGMTDSDSMNTIFLCLAARMPPKPQITPAEAKDAILAIRDNGTSVRGVQDFIMQHAPHQMIDGLMSLWEDEFYPDIIDVVILENLDDTPETVIRILAEHCHIKAADRKSSGGSGKGSGSSAPKSTAKPAGKAKAAAASKPSEVSPKTSSAGKARSSATGKTRVPAAKKSSR